MNQLFTDPSVGWAIALVIVLPVAIIGAGEIEERLRQRDSALTPVVSIVRRWTIPVFAVWASARGLFGLEDTHLANRALLTALLVSMALAGLAVLRVGLEWWRARHQAEERGRVPELLLALPRVFVVIAVSWLLIDGVWGVDLTAALAALGVTSLVASFALQDTLSGLASGLLLLTDSPFQPGDWIQFGDLQGRVVDINWRSSRIEDRNGDLMVVPNAQLAGATLVNYDEPSRLHRVVVPVQVAFANPPTLAKEMLLDAARSTPGVLETPAPSVRVVQIDDPLMGYEVDLWIDDFRIAPKVFSDFGSLVWYQSHRHEVPLPSPAYDLYVYDGVEVSQASRVSRTQVRKFLRHSAVLNQLDEDDIERLAIGARVARFAGGEIIIDGGDNRDVHLLMSGTARIVVDGADGRLLEAAELVEGDIFGMFGRSQHWPRPPRVVATTDCEVVIIQETAAGEVASRNQALADVFNQLTATRRRRIERMLGDVEPGTAGAIRDARAK